MDSVSDVPEDEAGAKEPVSRKQPAPVVKSTKKRARPSAGSRPGDTSKKAPAKKAAPVKKAAAKKAAPPKKAAAPKKAAPPKKAAAPKKAAPPVSKAVTAAAPSPTPPGPASVTPKSRQGHGPSRSSRNDFAGRRMAIIASVTEEMLNDLLPFLVGEGIDVDPLDTTVALPGMGDVAVRLGLTVVGVRAVLDGSNDGRIRMVVTAQGEVSTRTVDYEGDSMGATIQNGSGPVAPGLGMPIPAVPIPIIGEALVAPFIELRPGGSIEAGLDLSRAEFVSVTTDQTTPAPEGVEPTAWPGIVAMFGMLLGGIGAELFAELSEHVGESVVELDAELGSVFVQLGGQPGPLAISISSGLLTVGLPAAVSVEGAAHPVPIAGKRVGIGMASSVVSQVAQLALERAVGEMSLPFEMDVSLDEQAIGGRFKNSRLLPENFPDLRGALRTDVRTRLLRGQLELSVQAAWLEMPRIVPSFVNQFSRRLGSLVSLAPIRVRFPAVIPVPLPDDAGSLDVRLDDLRVTTEGIGLVASLA